MLLFEDYKSFLLSSHSEQSFKNAKQKIKTFHFFSSKTQITDLKKTSMYYILVIIMHAIEIYLGSELRVCTIT